MTRGWVNVRMNLVGFNTSDKVKNHWSRTLIWGVLLDCVTVK